jgi:hypothetical protein
MFAMINLLANMKVTQKSFQGQTQFNYQPKPSNSNYLFKGHVTTKTLLIG